jgi:hypothetical protein
MLLRARLGRVLAYDPDRGLGRGAVSKTHGAPNRPSARSAGERRQLWDSRRRFTAISVYPIGRYRGSAKAPPTPHAPES